MGIAFVSGIDGNSSNTLSVTVAAGTNCMVVHVATSTTGVTVAGITYAGVAMTRLTGGEKPVNNGYFDTWILMNPPVGTANVSVTWSAGVAYQVISVSMYSQVYSYSPGYTNTGEGTNVYVSCGVAQISGIVECAFSNRDVYAFANANQTANQVEATTYSRIYSSYKSVVQGAGVSVDYGMNDPNKARLNAVILYGGGGQVI